MWSCHHLNEWLAYAVVLWWFKPVLIKDSVAFMPLPHVSVTKHNHISSTIQASLHLAFSGLVFSSARTKTNLFMHTSSIREKQNPSSLKRAKLGELKNPACWRHMLNIKGDRRKNNVEMKWKDGSMVQDQKWSVSSKEESRSFIPMQTGHTHLYHTSQGQQSSQTPSCLWTDVHC